MASDTSTVHSSNHETQQDMTRDEILAVFVRRQAAYDNLDAVALAADYAPGAIVDSPTGGTHQGPAAIQKVLEAVFRAFLDLKVRTDQLLIDGNRVAQVLHIEGTDLGEFLGLSPTGKPFDLSAVFLFEFDGRQIVRERRIYDFTGLLVQIGGLRIKPT
jgi:predicted ester cyclase